MSTMYNVSNRSSSLVFYSIPEKNINRKFTPGETKKISQEELQTLAYQTGGAALIQHYLQIAETEGIKEFNGNVEPEYYLDANGVKDLILNGSLDAFLDCLDFAPEGVIDLIKKMSVDLPMTDANKALALKDKTGFDAFAAIKNNNASKEDEGEPIVKERRVKPAETTARRTTSKYTVVSE